MHSIRRAMVAGLSATVLLASFAGVAAAHEPTSTYRVTIVNLTDGQPFTPPLLATHRRSVDIYSVGRQASYGVQQIAENGDTGPLVSAFDGRRGVGTIAQGDAPLVPHGTPGAAMFGDTWTTTISTSRDANRLTWLSMLICTNDGFTGVDSLKLPSRVGGTVARYTAGYDAGSERNTEAFADIVPPCQGLIGVSGDPGTGASNPAIATHHVIRHHRGITGRADLVPAVHGWSDPVGLIVVQRIK